MIYVIHNGLVRGRVMVKPDGYRYMPFTSAHQPSRKSWPTPEAAIKGRTHGKLIEAAGMTQAIEMAKADATPAPVEGA